MPSRYAILGATGSTGQNLLKLLAKSPENQINVYIRSRAKLERIFPSIATQSNVHIFEGRLHDLDLMRRCVADVSAVFSVVATNDNIRNCSIAQDAASVLVETLQVIRDTDEQARLPRLIFLSSRSVNNSINDHASFGHWLVAKAFCNIYGDLVKAEAFLREHEDWLNVVFIQPGGLSSDPVQRGHMLSVTESAGGFLSYVDLAAGMIEVAQSGDVYDWKGVCVNPASTETKFEWMAPYHLTRGLWQCFWQWLF